MNFQKYCRAFLLLSMCAVTLGLSAQEAFKWYNPLEAPKGKSYVQNQGWNEDGGNFCRLPNRAESKVRKPVWNLSRNSAGIAVRLRTDARDIKVKYVVTERQAMPHMPATGVSGVDLYRTRDNALCWGKYSFGDTINYTFMVDNDSINGVMEEYSLYLPLYNTVKEMSIGVPEGSKLEFVEADTRKPIVLYGTSIAQGGCATRPAMAWSTILARSLDMPLINLGFSGNGRLEPEVLDFINEIDAEIFILDCIPNLVYDDPQLVEELVLNAVKQVREAHPLTPIVLVEYSGFSNGATRKSLYDQYTGANNSQAKAFYQLKAAGDDNLYYVEQSQLGVLPEGTADNDHPSDLGMTHMAKALREKLSEILKQ